MIRSFNPFITYGYITGRLRVLETTLISSSQRQRLFAAENLYELQTVLAETVYGDALREVNTIDEAEEVLNTFLAENYALIDASISNLQVKQHLNVFFRLKYDFINLKSWLKSGLGQEIRWPLSKLGLLPPETWAALPSLKLKSREGFYQDLLKLLLGVKDAAYAKFKQYGKVEIIDAVLDKAYYQMLLNASSQLKSKWLTNLTKYFIDLANLKILKRLLDGVTLAAPLNEYLIAGGFLSVEKLKLAITPNDILAVLAVWPDSKLKDLLTDYLTTNKTIKYDYIVDEWLQSYLVTAKFKAAGLQVVIAYLLKRELEIKQVRTLLFAHLATVKTDFIKQWVAVVG